MKQRIRTLLGAAAGALLMALVSGCSTPVPLEGGKDVPIESRTPSMPGGGGAGGAGGTGGAGGQAAGQSGVTPVNVDKSAGMVGAGRTVYFDFDSFVVKDEFRPVIEAHAKALSADRKKRLVIEGHTDERGGREYNLALGQKRAEAVAKALALLGAADGQLESVSFGKERPAAQGSDEAAWAQNRRAELKDR